MASLPDQEVLASPAPPPSATTLAAACRDYLTCKAAAESAEIDEVFDAWDAASARLLTLLTRAGLDGYRFGGHLLVIQREEPVEDPIVVVRLDRIGGVPMA
jgi:hypothetical protein